MDTSTQFGPARKAGKVNVGEAATGPWGQRYLAVGEAVGMRLWIEDEPVDGDETRRDYETVGFVMKGRAELTIDGETVALAAGDSWVVPAHAPHRYRILEPFAAIEATSPPARREARDV